MPTERKSIDEIERLLQREEDEAIRILPDGTVERNSDDDWMWRHFGMEPPQRKPLTMRENLGGEY